MFKCEITQSFESIFHAGSTKHVLGGYFIVYFKNVCDEQTIKLNAVNSCSYWTDFPRLHPECSDSNVNKTACCVVILSVLQQKCNAKSVFSPFFCYVGILITYNTTAEGARIQKNVFVFHYIWFCGDNNINILRK